MTSLKLAFSAAFVAAMGFMTLVPAPARAAVCSAAEAGAVVTNIGCQVGTTNNDFLGPTPAGFQVNLDSMFGITTWDSAGKDEFGVGASSGNQNIGLSISFNGSATGGSWSINSNVFSLWQNVMLVLKGPAGGTTQPNYIGYLLDSTSGTFTTPFFNLRNGNGQGVSHITAYVSGPVNEIPVPAALPLLLTALGGLGLIARRRRRAAAS